MLPTVSYWTAAVLLRKLNSEAREGIEGRKGTKLIEKTVERTESDDTPAPPDEPSVVDMPMSRLDPGSDTDATIARRERRARRASSEVEPLDFNAKRERRARRASAVSDPIDAEPAAPASTDPDGAPTAIEAQQTDGEAGQTTAEKIAAADASSAVGEAASAGELARLPEASAATLAIALSDKKSSRNTRALARAERTQQEAAVALHDAGEHPAVGALNRHLNMLTLQLETAHRVVGRVAVERDALRQQLADLQGVPVEEIVVTSIAAVTDDRLVRTREHSEHRAAKTREHGEPVDPAPPSAIARLNYFRHEDIAVMRRRRQIAALCLLGVVLVLWLTSKMGFFQLPENLGKDSLSQLPVVGELMSYFLAGWVLYRVVRVSSKGVKWIFPSEPKHKRR